MRLSDPNCLQNEVGAFFVSTLQTHSESSAREIAHFTASVKSVHAMEYQGANGFDEPAGPINYWTMSDGADQCRCLDLVKGD